MKNILIKVLAVMCVTLSLLSLTSCGSNTDANTKDENTNVKDESNRNSDNNESNIILLENEKIAAVLSENEKNPQLEKALKEEYDLDEAAAKQTRYYYNYVDLNGDGKNEIVAEIVGPFTSGSGGDSVIIYTENNGILEEVDDFSLIMNPIIISDEKTNGWNNIIVEYSNGSSEKKYIVLKYDGDDYSDIDESEVINSLKDVSGIAIISNDMAEDLEDGRGLYLG